MQRSVAGLTSIAFLIAQLSWAGTASALRQQLDKVGLEEVFQLDGQSGVFASYEELVAALMRREKLVPHSVSMTDVLGNPFDLVGLNDFLAQPRYRTPDGIYFLAHDLDKAVELGYVLFPSVVPPRSTGKHRVSALTLMLIFQEKGHRVPSCEPQLSWGKYLELLLEIQRTPGKYRGEEGLRQLALTLRISTQLLRAVMAPWEVQRLGWRTRARKILHIRTNFELDPPWPDRCGRFQGVLEFPQRLQGALSEATTPASRARILLLYLGWSKDAFIKRSGLSKRNLNYLLLGGNRRVVRQVPPRNFKKLADALRVDPLFLLVGSGYEILRNFPFGERLKLLRLAHGFRMDELAQASRRSKRYFRSDRSRSKDPFPQFALVRAFSGTLEVPALLLTTGYLPSMQWGEPKFQAEVDRLNDWAQRELARFYQKSNLSRGGRRSRGPDEVEYHNQMARALSEQAHKLFSAPPFRGELSWERWLDELMMRMIKWKSGTLQRVKLHGLMTEEMARSLEHRRPFTLEEQQTFLANLMREIEAYQHLISLNPHLIPWREWERATRALLGRGIPINRYLYLIHLYPELWMAVSWRELVRMADPETYFGEKQEIALKLVQKFDISFHLAFIYATSFEEEEVEGALSKTLNYESRLLELTRRRHILNPRGNPYRQGEVRKLTAGNRLASERIVKRYGKRDFAFRGALSKLSLREELENNWLEILHRVAAVLESMESTFLEPYGEERVLPFVKAVADELNQLHQADGTLPSGGTLQSIVGPLAERVRIRLDFTGLEEAKERSLGIILVGPTLAQASQVFAQQGISFVAVVEEVDAVSLRASGLEEAQLVVVEKGATDRAWAQAISVARARLLLAGNSVVRVLTESNFIWQIRRTLQLISWQNQRINRFLKQATFAVYA